MAKPPQMPDSAGTWGCRPWGLPAALTHWQGLVSASGHKLLCPTPTRARPRGAWKWGERAHSDGVCHLAGVRGQGPVAQDMRVLTGRVTVLGPLPQSPPRPAQSPRPGVGGNGRRSWFLVQGGPRPRPASGFCRVLASLAPGLQKPPPDHCLHLRVLPVPGSPLRKDTDGVGFGAALLGRGLTLANCTRENAVSKCSCVPRSWGGGIQRTVFRSHDSRHSTRTRRAAVTDSPLAHRSLHRTSRGRCS